MDIELKNYHKPMAVLVQSDSYNLGYVLRKLGMSEVIQRFNSLEFTEIGELNFKNVPTMYGITDVYMKSLDGDVLHGNIAMVITPANESEQGASILENIARALDPDKDEQTQPFAQIEHRAI